MGDTANLSTADAELLLESGYKWLKRQEGKVRFYKLNLNGAKEEILRDSGILGVHRALNASEWEQMWEELAYANFPGVRVISGSGKSSILQYCPKQTRQQADQFIQENDTMADSNSNRVAEKQAVKAFIDIMNEYGQLTVKEAREFTALRLGVPKLENLQWARIVRSGIAQAPKRGLIISIDGDRYVCTKLNKSQAVTTRQTTGEQAQSAGAKLNLPPGTSLEFDGDIQVEGEGPSGTFKLKLTKVTITILGLLLCAAIVYNSF